MGRGEDFEPLHQKQKKRVMEGIHMKLRMILGLLLAGRLFVGTAVQAQDNDLTAEDLDALEQAQEAVETATTAEERQKAEENLQQLEDELQAGERQAPVPGIGNVFAVTVDCAGDCNRPPTLGQICRQVGADPVPFVPFAVDCSVIVGPPSANIPPMTVTGPCPGEIMTCGRFSVRPGLFVGNFCRDIEGQDAHVFCVRPE
jgi:hypothetical protein